MAKNFENFTGKVHWNQSVIQRTRNPSNRTKSPNLLLNAFVLGRMFIQKYSQVIYISRLYLKLAASRLLLPRGGPWNILKDKRVRIGLVVHRISTIFLLKLKQFNLQYIRHEYLIQVWYFFMLRFFSIAPKTRNLFIQTCSINDYFGIIFCGGFSANKVSSGTVSLWTPGYCHSR